VWGAGRECFSDLLWVGDRLIDYGIEVVFVEMLGKG